MDSPPENHEHKWKLPESGVVIDTYPPTYTYYCDCGAATHDPETGEECRTKHYDHLAGGTDG